MIMIQGFMSFMEQTGTVVKSFETVVEQVIQRTHDTKSFRFKRPADLNFLPGQWLFVSVYIGNEPVKKPFSISSSPTDDFLEFTKKIRVSEFSRALDKIKPGDRIRLEGPYGGFVYAREHPKLGFLSGGIGITPFYSMLKYISDKKLLADVILLYANKTKDDIVFREGLESIQAANPGIKVLDVISRDPSWPGLKGHIDSKMIREQIPDCKERVFYICGPPAMVDAMSKELKALGLPDDRVIIEKFTGYD